MLFGDRIQIAIHETTIIFETNTTTTEAFVDANLVPMHQNGIGLRAFTIRGAGEWNTNLTDLRPSIITELTTSSNWIPVYVSISILAFMFFILMGMCLAYYRKKASVLSLPDPDEWSIARGSIVKQSKLARGAFGTVYLGTILGSKRQPDQIVAIKECHINIPVGDKRKFIAEGELLKQLSFPGNAHVVMLMGVCMRQEPLQILLEYAENGSLKEFLIAHPDLNLACLLQFCENICNAMVYLEARNILHRDLACRNCLVFSDLTVRISDFGLSCHSTGDEEVSSNSIVVLCLRASGKICQKSVVSLLFWFDPQIDLSLERGCSHSNSMDSARMC